MSAPVLANARREAGSRAAEISSGFAREISLECRARTRDRKLCDKKQGWRFAMKSRPGPLAIDLSLELKEYF